MDHTSLFSFTSFVYFFLIYISSNRAIILPEIKGNLPDPSVLSRIFNEFLRPIMTRSFPLNSPINKETEVEKAIREKVKELEPLLQDNDVTADFDNLMLEDKDETTIIEFLPKTEDRKKGYVEDDAFKSHLKKYKKIREKINKALKKESVSIKTKDLVIKTLDDLIKSLVSSQCKWKRNLRAKKLDKSSTIASKWNSGLQKIKDIFLSFIDDKHVKSRRNNDMLKVLDAIEILFRSVTEDVDVIAKKYKILCDFVPKEPRSGIKSAETNLSALRNNWDKTDLEEDRCQNLVVCSNELKDFLGNFYHSLNDTAVSVLRTYAEMYTRDANVDAANEKDVIVSLLHKIIYDFEEGITQAFIKETSKLNLDKEKNRQANIKVFSNYITNSVEAVKNIGKNLLRSELSVLRDKILSIIMDDLNVNMDVDLGNLEREFTRKICNNFRFCNGKYKGRRLGSSNTNKNNLYVQVQLTLDDNMTDINSYRKFFKMVSLNATTVSRLPSNIIFTVTRTTLFSTAANNTV